MNKPLLYYIRTFGCQMNINDSEFIAGQLEDMGYKMTPDMHDADIIILNTCCVRKNVENKIYTLSGIIRQIKKIKPNLIFCICGCLAQKEQENIQKRVPSVDLIFGPSQSSTFDRILKSFLDHQIKRPVIHCNNRVPFQLQNTPIRYQNPVIAYIQIMKGCNNFCSYCIVPYTRGPEESRAVEELLSEINKLGSLNIKEIILLGQNVNSYGYDTTSGEKETFMTLLSRINKIEGIQRIRFITSHPKDFNLDLIKVIKEGKKLCEHIHLPLQSGSDKILKNMNRKYDMQHYYSIISYIRKYMPEASITTDVMIGFPGETEEDFQDTLEAFKKIRFDSAYSFVYSDREQTLAALFKDQIPKQIKKRRIIKLIDLQNNISKEINERIVGKTVEILIESRSKKGIENQYWGKTRTNKVVVFSKKNDFKGNECLVGQMAYVKVQQADSYTLYGDLADVQFK